MILGKNEYRIIKNNTFGNEHLTSLYLLYAPLFKTKALEVYNHLYFDYRLNKRVFSDLFKRLNINNDIFELALKELERFNLLKTYLKDDGDNQAYLFILLLPLTTSEFLDDYQLSMMVKNKISINQYASVKMGCLNISTEGYKDISVKNIVEGDEILVNIPKKRLEKINDDDIFFDLNRMLAKTSNLILPSELRTADNLNEIARIADVYGIGVEQMITQIALCVDPNEKTIDLEKLEYRTRMADISNIKLNTNNKYHISCALFLRQISKSEVSEYDKKLLNMLSRDYGLKPYLINVLVEHTLKANNQKLPQNYLKAIASTWKRLKITSTEEAIKNLNDTVNKFKKKEIKVKKDSKNIDLTTLFGDKNG